MLRGYDKRLASESSKRGQSRNRLRRLGESIKDRLLQAESASIAPDCIDWSRMFTAATSEHVESIEEDEATASADGGALQPFESTLHTPMSTNALGPAKSPRSSSGATTRALDINSGGRVLFCLFDSNNAMTPKGDVSPACTPFAPATALSPTTDSDKGNNKAPSVPWSCAVLKFVPSRLLAQSEQFANELTRYVGLAAPESRILRASGPTADEWKQVHAAATQLAMAGFPALLEEMSRSRCLIIMEYVPGGVLLTHSEAFRPAERLLKTLEDMGRLFALDMLLGNADRLTCEALGWRGNSGNILWSTSGRLGKRVVAIDSSVSRRPPGGLLSAEDAACERVTELALNDRQVAQALLLEMVGSEAVDAVKSGGEEAVAAFTDGLAAGLTAIIDIKGLLEMMFDVVGTWIDDFLADVESTTDIVITPPPPIPTTARRSMADGGGPPSLSASSAPSFTTAKIRMITHEAQKNQTISEKMSEWKVIFREKIEELRMAVDEWQTRRAKSAEGGTAGLLLTTGFLDGAHPIVDLYELKVRLEHMLQRLRVLQVATATARPVCLLPRLYLGDAVAAHSLHVLKHLGVTHIVNATEDLLAPPDGHGFEYLRCPLKDLEEEDLQPHIPVAMSFLEKGLSSGGSVLVHCHAGRSRSCSLLLAWLMHSRKWTLKRALEHLQSYRPEAAPNAGYMAALIRLEEELHGKQTVTVKRTKPEPKQCPECGEKVGLSEQSLTVHLKLKHPHIRTV